MELLQITLSITVPGPPESEELAEAATPSDELSTSKAAVPAAVRAAFPAVPATTGSKAGTICRKKERARVELPAGTVPTRHVLQP